MILFLASLFVDPVHRVDRIELNHVVSVSCDDAGKPTQYVRSYWLFERLHGDGEYHVHDWANHLNRDRMQRLRGRYELTVTNNRDELVTIAAPLYEETVTRWDVEVFDKTQYPEIRREPIPGLRRGR